MAPKRKIRERKSRRIRNLEPEIKQEFKEEKRARKKTYERKSLRIRGFRPERKVEWVLKKPIETKKREKKVVEKENEENEENEVPIPSDNDENDEYEIEKEREREREREREEKEEKEREEKEREREEKEKERERKREEKKRERKREEKERERRKRRREIYLEQEKEREEREEEEEKSREQEIEEEMPELPDLPNSDPNSEDPFFRPNVFDNLNDPEPTQSVRALKYIGPLYQKRFEENGFSTLQDIIDFIRTNTNEENTLTLMEILQNARSNRCIDVKNSQRPGFNYLVQETNKFAYNSVVTYLRKRLTREEQFYIPEERKHYDVIRSFHFENRIPPYLIMRTVDEAFPDRCEINNSDSESDNDRND